MRIIYIKNASGEAQTWHGKSFDVDDSYQLEEAEVSSWSNDSEILAAIANGDAVVNNGDSDFSDPVQGWTWLSGSVIKIGPEDSDNAPLTRLKICPTGWHMHLACFEFETSKLNSGYEKYLDGTDRNFLTMKFYNASDEELTTQQDIDSGCVKTVVDWEPTHDFEIIAGSFRQSSAPSSDVRVWVVGVPDIPPAYGGSVCFCCGLNLMYYGANEGGSIDGRTAKKLVYDSENHTSKMRFILRHGAGVQHKIHAMMEVFEA